MARKEKTGKTWKIGEISRIHVGISGERTTPAGNMVVMIDRVANLWPDGTPTGWGVEFAAEFSIYKHGSKGATALANAYLKGLKKGMKL